MALALRPFAPEDLPLLPGGDSEFDDWGPTSRNALPGSSLDAPGGLVVVDGAGEVLGDVSWHFTQWGPTSASRCVMIGIWLRPEARGKGHGSAAQRALVELLFEHTTTYRIEAHTDVDNVAEQRALERAGFQREGRLRGAQWRKGAHRDGYLYSVLRSDL